MKRKAVFVVQEWSRAGGLEIVTQDYVGVFRKLGFDILVLVTRGSGDDIEEPCFKVLHCVPRLPLMRSIWHRFIKFRDLARRVERELKRGDILVISHAYLLDVLKYAHLQPDVIRWVWTHGVDAWFWRAKKLASYQQWLTRVIAVSEYTAKQERENGIAIPVSVIANNADIRRFVPDNDMSRIRRNEILISSRLTEHTKNKGHDILFKAVMLAERQLGFRLHVRVLGTGPAMPEFKELAARECPGRVTFEGRVSETALLEAYQHCAVFCMPSRVEFDEAMDDIRGDGFGLVYVEAQACGRPAIGSIEGGAVETIEDGVTGFKVNPRDPEELAVALVRVLGDANLSDIMGTRAREFVISRFSHEAFEKRIEEVLNEDL